MEGMEKPRLKSSTTAVSVATVFDVVPTGCDSDEGGAGEAQPAAEGCGRLHERLQRLVTSTGFELAVGLIILFNGVLVIMETDRRAECREQLDFSRECVDVWWCKAASILMLALYCVEIALRCSVLGTGFLLSYYNILDVLVVVLGIMGEIFGTFGAEFLRIFRILRLFRAIRSLCQFRELYMMLHGFLSTLKAIGWAAVLMFVLLTMWSIVAVEVLHTVNMEIAETGYYVEHECDRCPRALRSVMEANLTFFQTVILGDEWGRSFVPIVERQPWALVILLGVNFTVALGLTSLILSVIVDRASEAREDDVRHQLAVKQTQQQKAKGHLVRLCKAMDENKDGTLSVSELLRGFDNNLDFRGVLQLMDVDKEDLESVFRIMDADKSGTVSYHEFAELLYRMKVQNSRTLLMFIKYYVLELRNQMQDEIAFLKGDIMNKLQVTHDHVSAVKWDCQEAAAGPQPPAPPPKTPPMAPQADSPPLPPPPMPSVVPDCDAECQGLQWEPPSVEALAWVGPGAARAAAEPCPASHRPPAAAAADGAVGGDGLASGNEQLIRRIDSRFETLRQELLHRDTEHLADRLRTEEEMAALRRQIAAQMPREVEPEATRPCASSAERCQQGLESLESRLVALQCEFAKKAEERHTELLAALGLRAAGSPRPVRPQSAAAAAGATVAGAARTAPIAEYEVEPPLRPRPPQLGGPAQEAPVAAAAPP